MAYKSKKKREEERLANLAASNSSAASLVNEPLPEPEPVETEVDAQASSPTGIDFGSLIGRAADNLHAGVTGETPRVKKKYNYNSQKKNTDEVSTLFVSLLTLGVAAWKVPSEMKPSEEEIDAFSVPATRMLLRHVNLSGRITADVVDSIAMIAVIAGYYARTNEMWRAMYPPKSRLVIQTPTSSIPDGYPRPTHPMTDDASAYQVHEDGSITPVADPIADIDPGASDYLNERLRKHGTLPDAS